MISNQELLKGWIQYLKNNQIAGMQSDSKTGRLNYKRPVTEDDLIDFLQLKTEFSDEDIRDAIDASRQSPQLPSPTDSKDTQISTAQDRTDTSRQPPQPSTQQPKKYNTDDAEDIDFREVHPTARIGNTRQLSAPNSTAQEPIKTGGKQPGLLSQTPTAIRKRELRAAETGRKTAGKGAFSQMAKQLAGKGAVKEALDDTPGPRLSEKEIESIFKILSASLSKTKSPSPARPAKTATQSTVTIDSQEEIRKLKRVIRDTMSNQQRMALWRALTDA